MPVCFESSISIPRVPDGASKSMHSKYAVFQGEIFFDDGLLGCVQSGSSQNLSVTLAVTWLASARAETAA